MIAHKNTDLKPSNILLELDDPEAVISNYLKQTSVRTFQSKRTGLGDVDTGSEETAIPTLLSEVIITPLLSEMDDIRVRIIDFGVCMLFFSFCLTFAFSGLSKVTNFPLTASWVSQHLSEQIQSPYLRAPEVTLGAPWSTGVDIWSLGCLVCYSSPKIVENTCGRRVKTLI
jgi:serine/threonine-protein kinase SRPK3